jgi:Tyrosine phosphatase family
MRPIIMSRLALEPLFASDPTAAHNLLSSRFVQYHSHLAIELISFDREETMQAFIRMLDERYGGVKEYVRRTCSLTDQDMVIIRQNLLVPIP